MTPPYGSLPTPTRVGYIFRGWFTEKLAGEERKAADIYKAASDTTLYARWEARTDITYLVNIYKMKLDGKTYILEESETKQGTADATLTLADLAKTYTGFTYDSGKVSNSVVTTTTISPDGSRVIDLYYSRNKYDYTINHYLMNLDGKTYTLDSSVTDKAYYGASITGTVKSYTGFTSPAAQTITISTSGNVISYHYSRNRYTVTWKNWDSTVLKTDSVYYGATPTYTGATPTKPATREGYRWDFTGWTPSVSTVTGSATYTATFTEVLDNVTITWKNWDGTVLATDVVKCGTIPSYGGTTPTRASTSSKHYTFSGWSPTITSATASVTYTATFTEANHSYGTTSYNWNGCSSCTASAACTSCGYTKTESGSVSYHDISDATCTTPDTWEHVATFATLGESRCPYVHDGSPLGHNPGSWTTSSYATCTSDGLRVQKCTRCGETLDSETIDALGHDWGQWAVTKAATCSSTGERTRTCVRGCEDTESIPTTSHNFVLIETESATCTEDGCKYYECPQPCGERKSEVIKATGHNWEDATCTSPQTCKNCGKTSGSALGHNLRCNEDGYPAECETKGKTDSYTCRNCHVVVITQTEIAPLGHDYQYNIVAIGWVTCSRCDWSSVGTFPGNGDVIMYNKWDIRDESENNPLSFCMVMV